MKARSDGSSCQCLVTWKNFGKHTQHPPPPPDETMKLDEKGKETIQQMAGSFFVFMDERLTTRCSKRSTQSRASSPAPRRKRGNVRDS
ncbi:hypothetical protein ACHAWF_001234 [Thalassiosira exigua]